MSRARSINLDGEIFWFDTHKDSLPASVEKLELLAAVENIDPDDLLDEGLNQGAVILRLRKSLGQGVIPVEVLERQRARKEAAGQQKICRVHGDTDKCEGRITRHHFISRWLMKELENYQSYARRDKCTIPICMGFHRDLHMRQANGKSIVEYLNNEERAFAEKMLSEFEEQHPKIIKLLRKGDPEVSYEARLIRDYDEGKFSHLTSSEKSVYFEDVHAAIGS
jgi:hypothetical protein